MSEFSALELKHAVLLFAQYLGINIEKEPLLIKIAEDALLNLPEGWELGIGDMDENEGIPYFFNVSDGSSEWVHPSEKRVMRLLKDERKRLYSNSRSSDGNIDVAIGSSLDSNSGRSGNSKRKNDSKESRSSSSERNTIVLSSEALLGVPGSAIAIPLEGDTGDIFGVQAEPLNGNNDHFTFDGESNALRVIPVTDCAPLPSAPLLSSSKATSVKKTDCRNRSESKSTTSTTSPSTTTTSGASSIPVRSSSTADAASCDRVNLAFSPKASNDQFHPVMMDGSLPRSPPASTTRSTNDQLLYSDVYLDLQRKYNILESRNRHLEHHMKQSEKDYEELSDKNAVLNQNIISLEEQLENHRSDLVTKEGLQLQHADALKELRENHDHAMNELKRNEENKYNEMLKRLKSAHSEQMNALRMECTANMRLVNHAEAEYANKIRKIERKCEKELLELKLTNMELTEKYDAAKLELKKMREEQMQLSSKLTSTLQLFQISKSECESAKIETKHAEIKSQGAVHRLAEAMQNLQVAEDEIVKLKYEILQLQNESTAHTKAKS